MMRYILAALLVPAMMPQLSGLVLVPGERQILSAEAAWVRAKRTGDHATLDRLLAKNFVGVNRFGRLLGKRGTIAISGDSGYATADVHLRLYTDGAVVTGLESHEGDVPDSTRFLRVWTRHAGAWRLLADQETAVTSETELARLQERPPVSFDRIVVDHHGANSNHVAGGMETSSTEARQVRAAEQAYRLAERANNLDILEHYQAKEFQRVDQLGELVEPHARPEVGVMTVNNENFSVRVSGTIAVVVGDVLRDYVDNEASDQFRYLAVWERQTGSWRIVAEDRTPVVHGAAKQR